MFVDEAGATDSRPLELVSGEPCIDRCTSATTSEQDLEREQQPDFPVRFSVHLDDLIG
jgi:hypothetical protein